MTKALCKTVNDEYIIPVMMRFQWVKGGMANQPPWKDIFRLGSGDVWIWRQLHQDGTEYNDVVLVGMMWTNIYQKLLKY